MEFKARSGGGAAGTRRSTAGTRPLWRGWVAMACALALSHASCGQNPTRRAAEAAALSQSPLGSRESTYPQSLQGAIDDFPGCRRGFIIRIASNRGSYSGTIKAPMWGPSEWPVLDLFVAGGQVSFKVGPETGPFGAFRFGAVGDDYVGSYTWEGTRYTARMGTKPVAECSSPVTAGFPSPPFPYTTTRVSFRGGSGQRISGVVTVPRDRRRHGGVVLLAGASLARPRIPGDLDPPLAACAWADRISRAGFVMLSLDSRGAGGSEGKKRTRPSTRLVTTRCPPSRTCAGCRRLLQARLGWWALVRGSDVRDAPPQRGEAWRS